MGLRLPSSVHFDPRYVCAVVERETRSGWAHLGRGLLQLPRLALFLGLGMMILALTHGLWIDLRSFFVLGRHLDPATFGIAVWTWGLTVLLVELCVLAVRDAAASPWPGSASSTGGLLLRAHGGAGLFALLSAANLGPIPSLLIALPSAYCLFAWSLPSALRGAISSQSALRSLRTVGDPISPGRLATERGKLGRRLVTGRVDTGDGVLSISGDGELARLDARDLPALLQLDPLLQPMVLIAEAHVDDGGYRSGGVRLATGSLPIWLVAAEGIGPRLQGFRARLRLALLLDGIYVASVALGGVFFAAYIALAQIARI